MSIHIRVSAAIVKPVLWLLDCLTPFGDLLARLWVAKIFFSAGFQKIADWQTTVMLFQNMYHVPLLSPTMAAYLGTGLELILPVFLVLGLGGRFFIFILFVYNIMCVLSFHFLLTPEGAAGLSEHIDWGLLILLLMLHGPGKFSLDYLIRKKWGNYLKDPIQIVEK